MKTTVQRKRQFQKGAAPTIGCGNGSGTFDGSMELGQILYVMAAYKNGDFSVRLPSTWTGVLGKMSDTMNDILAVSESRAEEIVRVCRVVGKEGRLKQRFSVPGMSGGWADEIDSLNTLIDDLVSPTTEVTRAVGAVAKGDLSQAMALEKDGRAARGRIPAERETGEQDDRAVRGVHVGSHARGARSRHGRQTRRAGAGQRCERRVEGSHRLGEPDGRQPDGQVANIAEVTIAVANGDFSKKITVDVKAKSLS